MLPAGSCRSAPARLWCCRSSTHSRCTAHDAPGNTRPLRCTEGGAVQARFSALCHTIQKHQGSSQALKLQHHQAGSSCGFPFGKTGRPCVVDSCICSLSAAASVSHDSSSTANTAPLPNSTSASRDTKHAISEHHISFHARSTPAAAGFRVTAPRPRCQQRQRCCAGEPAVRVTPPSRP